MKVEEKGRKKKTYTGDRQRNKHTFSWWKAD